jgi:hypothetical protein
MSDPHAADVIGSLPHSRPHRRSPKRPARASEPGPAETITSVRSEPVAGRPPARSKRSAKPVPEPQTEPDLLGTAVQAAAEIAEIGLSVSARALRRAVARLPRP